MPEVNTQLNGRGWVCVGLKPIIAACLKNSLTLAKLTQGLPAASATRHRYSSTRPAENFVNYSYRAWAPQMRVQLMEGFIGASVEAVGFEIVDHVLFNWPGFKRTFSMLNGENQGSAKYFIPVGQ